MAGPPEQVHNLGETVVGRTVGHFDRLWCDLCGELRVSTVWVLEAHRGLVLEPCVSTVCEYAAAKRTQPLFGIGVPSHVKVGDNLALTIFYI